MIIRIPNHSYDTIRLGPSLLFLCAICLAVAAVFLPWFRWNEHTWLAADGRSLNTTNLNNLLPSTAVGTREAWGAQIHSGNCALWIGSIARLIVLGISVLSFWQLIRHRTRRYRILISLLLLPIFLGLLAYVVLNNWMIDLVILKDEKALPYIIRVEWPGPTSLIGALSLHVLDLLWQIRTRAISKHA